MHYMEHSPQVGSVVRLVKQRKVEKKIAIENDEHVLIENRDMLSGYYFSDCPVGWSELLRQLFKDIRSVCANHKCPLPLVLQVKSKFGSLCFYLDHEFDLNSTAGIEVKQVIWEAEMKSYYTCEITGQPAFRYVKDGWFATLSETIAKELGYTQRVDFKVC